MTWRAVVEQSFALGGAALRVAKFSDQKMSEVTDFTFVDRVEGEIITDSPLMYGPECVSFMQAMMDAAYEYGLRPSKAKDERHMKAHLEDMRCITFHALKMNKSGG